MKKIRFMLMTLFLVLGITYSIHAQMHSDSYRMTTSVISGGGAPMGSDNYQTESTLGQPSPLMDPLDPPVSENYYLYPGFQYTLTAGVPDEVDLADFALAYGSISPEVGYNFLCDFDHDGDVDGMDLADF